ncbi:MAG: hypothetical protein ABFD24_01745 [Anaerolineaceae bacterium]
MKKNSSIAIKFMLLFALLMMTVQPVSATANTGSTHSERQIVKAQLTNNKTGEKINLPVTKKVSQDGKKIEYEVIVMSGSVSESHSRLDASLGIRLTVTQYYDENWGAERYVSLDRSTAKWEKLDSSISITNAKITSSVWAYKQTGGLLNKVETKTIGIPTSNTWYTQYPSWRGIYVIINDLSWQASRADSTLVRGGSSWTLGLCVAQGGSAWVDCE